MVMSYVSTNYWHDALNKVATDLFTFGYKHVVKPHFVFNHAPDEAHDNMVAFCRLTKGITPLMWLLRETIDYTDPILQTQALGLDFANPFGLSAGLDKNCDMPVLMDNAGFGFETVGSITSRPCAGNAKPWFHRLPEYDSMIVHVGLANDGSAKVIERVNQAERATKTMRMSISIARTNDDLVGDIDEGIEDYRLSLAQASGRSSMVEINISCPNTRVGEPFVEDPANLDRLFTELDNVSHPQPLLVKMPQDTGWPHFHELLDVLARHDVQGVTIANLRKDRTGLSIPRDWEGGLSGGPAYQSSNELIRNTYREFGSRFAIAGVGGVFTPKQAYAKIRAGSSLVMFITSLMYRGPQQVTVLKRGLAELLRADGFEHVSDAVGIDA
jgi:dihydroorotate dehydrogenase (fumarate)